MPKKITKLFNIETKNVDKEYKTLKATLSSQQKDRYGDVVIQEGWDLKNFKKNPVIINSHNHSDATEVVGKVEKGTLKIEKGKLTGKIKFAVNENPKAKIIFDLYAGGYLNAFSVGFLANEYDEKDFGKITKAELLEVSAVSVPANAFALAKKKGIEVDKLSDKEYEKPNNKSDDENKTIKKSDAKSGKNKDGKEKRKEDKTNKDVGNRGIQGDDKKKQKEKEDKVKVLLKRVEAMEGLIAGMNIKKKEIKEKKEVIRVEKSKEERMKEIINKYKNNKISSLAKISEAVAIVGNHYKGQNSSDKTNNNYLVNTAIKELLKLKD